MPNRALTDEDIKLLHETFADKKDHEELSNKVNLLPSKDLFLSEMAKLMKEVKDMREEFTIVEGRKDQLEDHEERITTLESSAVIANA